jgi:urease accessory protein
MSRVSIRAVRGPRGTVLDEIHGTEPWRPRVVHSNARVARVVLVQSRATLLSADDLELSISVDDDAALEVLELGATVVHHARDGAPANVNVRLEVADSGQLIWLGKPLIISHGARAHRMTAVQLAGTARVLIGESVVLGRARETPGELEARTRIVRGASPIIDETLHTSDSDVLRSPVVVGNARQVTALTLAGVRDPHPPLGAMQAHGEATLWRAAGEPVDIARQALAIEERWRTLLASEPTVQKLPPQGTTSDGTGPYSPSALPTP